MPTVDERYQAKLRARRDGTTEIRTYAPGAKDASGAPAYDLRTPEGRYAKKIADRAAAKSAPAFGGGKASGGEKKAAPKKSKKRLALEDRFEATVKDALEFGVLTEAGATDMRERYADASDEELQRISDAGEREVEMARASKADPPKS